MAASTFHEIRFLYKRTTTHEAEDVAFHGLDNTKEYLSLLLLDFQTARPHLQLDIDGRAFTSKSYVLKNATSAASQPTLVVVQYELQYETHTVGLISVVDQSVISDGTGSHHGTTAPFLGLRDHFAMIMLTQEYARFPPSLSLATDACMTQSWIDRICDLFESSLLFRGPENDQWCDGRSMFCSKVLFYVRSRAKVQFCLPAFPCKSCNLEKVAGLWPDGAEFEALSNIYAFCDDFRGIYPPGCVFEIVSDGHVFSDCIGVDDEVVTEYNARLHKMARRVRAMMPSSSTEDDCVKFKSLNDILRPGLTEDFYQQRVADVGGFCHPVKTSRTIHDDLNRGMLLSACSTDRACLQQTIHQRPQGTMTMLYRGFSRFMLDDLASHPDCKSLSKSRRKKLAERVALEMMYRNAAYSNLVELMFPKHVRLSIHAHNNSGPKFAISLLPQRKFRPLTSFDGLRLSTEYCQYDERHHLHIPTPWHNCLVEVEGDTTTYVCKAGLVNAELKRPQSVWSSRSGYLADHHRGGRYMLYRDADNERGEALTEVMRPQAVDVASLSVPHL